MAKKRKSQVESTPQQEPSTNEEELELIRQKEVNATLDMIIRSYEPSETTTNDNSTNGSNGNSANGSDEETGEDRTDDDDTCSNTHTCTQDLRCLIPQHTGLNLFLTCVDLFIFELDEEVIEKLILCAIVSMSLEGFLDHFKVTCFPTITPFIRSIEKQLDDRVANVYSQFLLQVMTGIQTAESKKDYIKNLFQSNLFEGGRKQNILTLLTSSLQNIFTLERSSADLQATNQQLDQIIRGAALAFLFNSFSFKLAEFQKAVGAKVICVETDLTFLSTELLRLTSANAGILQAANALVFVASARFAEEDDYDEIFEAVEEIADAIEDLAEIYQDRLKVLRALLPFSVCPRPVFTTATTPETDTGTE